MSKTAISVDHVARVEGHGDIRLVIEDGEVTSCELAVVEPARLFESMVRGRYFEEVPYIASRVCGICSSSHVVTDLRAIEQAFGVAVSDRTRALRELLVYGSYLQNHATHLFVFAAPDFLGHKSVFPLADANPALFDGALSLKALGNELCTKVGGRSIHPITAVVGGFTHEISPDEYLELAEKLEAAQPFALAAVDLFNDFDVVDVQTEGDMLAMVAPGAYPVIDSDTARFVRSGVEFDAAHVGEAIEEYAVGHSAAFCARVRATGAPYMTAALARINASWGALSRTARFAAAKAGLRPPEYNPFANNVAQAVEIVDALERCAKLCRRLAEPAGAAFEGVSEPVAFEVRAGRGVGFTEAPRGALFHELELDEEGRVVRASIMTPTAQNIANLEADMRQLAGKLVAAGESEEVIQLEVEKLVRAYDPCLSCSVH
ncbi:MULTISPECIES: Ni/Fe hydrogenase subunit alpha [unclassified Adlercreutzia]|uniref:Ni/Fe hydrogenase subunit alpha n=1 Tax=unclassified Adlercreutzia TaxID=2636013 RepID=UPI0013EDB57B|nr:MULTISPECIES: Ni/Fe hydrogenase subunit alpha [unclassified Adlercreutzia]